MHALHVSPCVVFAQSHTTRFAGGHFNLPTDRRALVPLVLNSRDLQLAHTTLSSSSTLLLCSLHAHLLPEFSSPSGKHFAWMAWAHDLDSKQHW